MTVEIIHKPIVTEKITQQADKLNRYGFIVDKQANKLEIKVAVEKMYSVTVNSVNTIRCRGKIKNRYTKSGVVQGKKNSYKKAIVTLVEGDKIDFYSNI